MQVRAGAAIAAAWLVLAGLLGLRHEATVVHAIDAHGAIVHGPHAIGHRGGRADHLHPHAGGDGGECSLAAALRQPGVAIAAPSVAPAPFVWRSLDPPVAHVADRTVALLRLAPKTSPPRA